MKKQTFLETLLLTLAVTAFFAFILAIIIIANPYLEHFQEVPVRYFPEPVPTETRWGDYMEEILTYLNRGKANAISKKSLTQLLNVDERTVRKNIAELRAKGIPIASNTKTGGILLASKWKRSWRVYPQHEQQSYQHFQVCKSNKGMAQKE